MGVKSTFALKSLQWFIRGIQFCCCAVGLALYSYFLAVAARNDVTIPKWVRAIEGITGVGVLYTFLGLLLLCWLAGHPLTSFIAIVLDIAFVGAFIYVAQANRGGAGSCRGRVDTPLGSGDAAASASGLPSFRTLCQMETAVFSVSIVAILFFILSALMEAVLVRHRRKEARFGPSPANNYTSGYGSRKGGFFSRFRRNKEADAYNPNALPQHATPDQIRQSYNTEATAVGNEPAGYPKYGEAGHQYDGQTAYPENGVTHDTGRSTNGYRY
ncbi:hypothetical protein DL770_005360 [Monosporascus sp. CRB-9-2]|nr:hypothetical protein DL770_005360 [Monosporascus sp. CRB-9-2]